MARIEAVFEQKSGLPLFSKVKRSASVSWEIVAQPKKYTLGPNFGIAEVSSSDSSIQVSIADKQKWVTVRPRPRTKSKEKLELTTEGDRIVLRDNRRRQNLTLTLKP